MMLNILKRRGLAAENGGQPLINEKTLTAEMFLARYVSNTQLLHFIDHARIEDVEGLDVFIGNVKDRTKMSVTRKTSIDKGGNPCKYPTFLHPNGPDGTKVILIGQIADFISDYQKGKFVINFTLDEVVALAETML